MTKDKFIDLHCHSTISDGTDTPEELIKLAINTGLSAFALTDHDITDGIPLAIKTIKDMEADPSIDSSLLPEIIPGVEISTEYMGKEVHIVGLFIDYSNRELCNELTLQRGKREEKNKEMCRLFKERGINVDYDTLIETYAPSVITRAHFADYLVKIGACGDKNEAFDRYIGDGKPMYVNRAKMEPAEAIKLIHNAGGVAIFAHPILCKLNDAKLEEFVKYMADAGLDGIEAYYSTYNSGNTRTVERLARMYNLALSGGSDYHGANKPKIKLGTGINNNLHIPYSLLNSLRK